MAAQTGQVDLGTITSLKVNGDVASLVTRHSHGSSDRETWIKTGDGWKVDAMSTWPSP